MKPQHIKIAVVAGVGLATIAYLWHEHGATAALPAAPKGKTLATSSVPIPKAKAKRTASNTPVKDVAIPYEPYTQLQLETAAAMGFANTESSASLEDTATSRALKEDLAYLGLGDS
jgi:hypothetical protein